MAYVYLAEPLPVQMGLGAVDRDSASAVTVVP